MRRRMSYYLSDGFPMLQNPAAGPYEAFLGTPRGFAPVSVCRLRVPSVHGRRLRVPLIRGLGAFGDITDVISGMVGEGYSPSVISSLVSAGATEDQLQSLWDNYEPGTADFAQAASEQLFLLTSGQQGHLTIPTTSSSTPAPAVQTQAKATTQAAPAAQTPFVNYGPYQPTTTYVPYLQPQPQPSWWSQWGGIVMIGGGVLGLVLLLRRR